MSNPHQDHPGLLDDEQEKAKKNKIDLKNQKKKERKKRNKNGNKQQVVLSDPLDVPPEVFSYLMSFLDPAGIALAMSACKSWRIPIRNDFTLHQELDLWYLGQGVDLQTLLTHFNRLSEMAKHRLIEVYLNMFCFWDDYTANGGVYDQSACPHFFRTLLSKSKRSIKEISLRFETESFGRLNVELFGFVNLVLSELQSYPKLEEIYIETPTSVNFKIESHSNHRRSFQVVDNSQELSLEENAQNYEIIDYAYVHQIAKLGVQLVGRDAGFTEFEVSKPPTLLSNYDASTSIVNTLSGSERSLEKLDLDLLQVRGKDIWDFSLQCSKLTKLQLTLRGPEATLLPPVHLDVPEGLTTNSNLKSLSLISSNCTFDWQSLSKWIPDNLQELSLGQLGNTEMIGGPDLHLILKSLVGSLQKRTLQDILPKTEINSMELKSFESFPKLESLTLFNVGFSAYDLLATSNFPKLIHLQIHCDRNNSVQKAFDYFLSLLKANSSRLARIRFDHGKAPPPNLPSESLRLEFPNLRSLAFGDENEEVGNCYLAIILRFIFFNRLQDFVRNTVVKLLF